MYKSRVLLSISELNCGTLGYGELIYELLYNGHIMALQVAPALKTAGNTTSVQNDT